MYWLWLMELGRDLIKVHEVTEFEEFQYKVWENYKNKPDGTMYLTRKIIQWYGNNGR